MSSEAKGAWAYLLSSAAAYIVYLAIVVPRLFRAPAAHVSYIAPLVPIAVASAVRPGVSA
ncbi:hypothetical protein [Actinoplanes sp. NPDC051411]|uniref:hypothetical protein n=1 Tax=Actinoplanes sp. NPDC051411 TaxID=3155522 RepID=UPI00342E9BAE